MSVTIPGIATTPFNANRGTTFSEKSAASSGGTYRGLGADWFNGTNVAYEDWMRAEQAQNNQLMRDLYFQNQANEFNAREAQKQRDYDERMSSTQYQRAIEDMKKAGINPVLAVQHGASFAGGTSASSSGQRTSSGNTGFAGANNSLGGLVGTILNIGAGLVMKGMQVGAMKEIGKAKASQPIQKIFIGGKR